MTKTSHPSVARARRSDPRAQAPHRRLISPPAAGTAASTRRFPSARPGATKTRDPRLIGTADGGTGRSPNIDDGDLNYKNGRVSSAYKMVAELSLDRGDNFGLFVRGSLLYDDLVEDSRDGPHADFGAGQGPRGLLLAPARRIRLWTLGPRRARARSCALAPGGELGREHLHPGRHQRRDQPFRRGGAARAGLGTARSLPAAGNAEGRLRAHRQPDGGGDRPLRLGSARSRSRSAPISPATTSCRAAAKRSSWASARSRTRAPTSRRSAGRSSKISRPCRAGPTTRAVGHAASMALRCAGSCRTSRRAPSSASTSSTTTASCRSSAAHRHAGRHRQFARHADRGHRDGAGPRVRAAASTPRSRSRPMRAPSAAAANGGDLSARRRPRATRPLRATPCLRGGNVSAQATALATHEYAQTARYFTEYPEDIQLFGVSFNTQLGDDRDRAPGRGVLPAGRAAAVRRRRTPVRRADAIRGGSARRAGHRDARDLRRRPSRRSRAAGSSAHSESTRSSRAGTSSTSGRAS